MNPSHPGIQGDFFEHIEFVTNVFTAIFVFLGVLVWFFNRKFRSVSLSWVQLVYSLGLIGLGVVLAQHQVKHYFGAAIVFHMSFLGLYKSVKVIFFNS